MDTNVRDRKPDISIIIPVYNVENYIDRCLDSIFCQQFTGNFEVIAVDDGSTDGSLAKLKAYQLKEPKLKIIEHTTNRKLSAARATGMNVSVGDYIMHVDSDDWLLPGALQGLFEKCKETDADVIVFNYVKENGKGNRTYTDSVTSELVTTDKDIVHSYFYGSPWNKIVKGALVKDMVSGQKGVNMTEDLLYATELFLQAKKFVLVPQNYYAYFENTSSLTWTMTGLPYLRNQVTIFHQLKCIFDRYTCEVKYKQNISAYLEKYLILYLTRILLFDKKCVGEGRKLLEELSLYEIMENDRIVFLKKVLSSQIFCLVQLSKSFGFRTSFSMVLRSWKIKLSLTRMV